MLDVYSPISAATEESPTILLFFYVGGLGAATKCCLSQMTSSTRTSATSSLRSNLPTVIVDYRRMSEGASFPSGGEDVAAVVEWVKSKYGAGNGSRDVFLMGNLAGGVHVATFILEPRFAALRASISPSIVGGVILRGYGDRQGCDAEGVLWAQGPRRLSVGFAAELQTSGRVITKDSSPLGALDPEGEIVQPALNFIEEWEGRESPGGLDQVVLEGHNHISPPMALGTGFQREEEWEVIVGKWIHDTRRQTGPDAQSCDQLLIVRSRKRALRNA